MPANGHGLTPYQKTKPMKNRVCAKRKQSPGQKAEAKSWLTMASHFLCQTWTMWPTSGAGSKTQASQTLAPWGQSPSTGQHCTLGSDASVCALSPGNCAPCVKPVAHSSAKWLWPETHSSHRHGPKATQMMSAPMSLKKSPPFSVGAKPKTGNTLHAVEFA